MANFTCLAAARHAVLRRVGWNVEELGLQGAPRVHVVLSEEAHSTVVMALRLLGLGAATAVRVPADAQGRLLADGLAAALAACDGPAIVCAQVGNVNSGACDPMPQVIAVARAHGAWVHVDSAFGLWARTAERRRALVKGVDGADSWATDAHKWLNVPYDSGIAIVREAAALHAAMAVGGEYLIKGAGEVRDELDWVPEFSRRARGPAAELTPPPWGAGVSVGFERFVQPVLDKHCGKCHQGNGEGRKKLDLTLREYPPTGSYPISFKEPYVTLVGATGWRHPRNLDKNAPGCGIAGAIYVEGGPRKEYGPLNPMTRLSYTSPLIDRVTSGSHHGVKIGGEDLQKLLAWVDCNCVYYGDEEVRAFPDKGCRDAPRIDRLQPITDPPAAKKP